MKVMGKFQTAQTGDWTNLTVSMGLMKPVPDLSSVGDMVVQSRNLGTQKKAPILLEE